MDVGARPLKTKTLYNTESCRCSVLTHRCDAAVCDKERVKEVIVACNATVGADERLRLFETLQDCWDRYARQCQRFFVTFDLTRHVPWEISVAAVSFFSHVSNVTRRHCIATVVVLTDGRMFDRIKEHVTLVYTPSRPILSARPGDDRLEAIRAVAAMGKGVGATQIRTSDARTRA